MPRSNAHRRKVEAATRLTDCRPRLVQPSAHIHAAADCRSLAPTTSRSGIAANGDLASIILVIRERVVQEELRFGWLAWAHLSALEMSCIRGHFNVSAGEPITESEYR